MPAKPKVKPVPPLYEGIDELRRAVALFDSCSESFNERFTSEELVTLWRAHHASGRDFYPDQWEEQQVADALERGLVPMWDSDKRATYPSTNRQKL